MKNNAQKILCLGGGIGTVNLIKGLKQFDASIAVAVSMADEGGSSGRLRRMYNILPPGDLVSCMTALCNKKNPLVAKLLTYRFPGDRYAKDAYLAGHKLGNLLMVALRDITGDFHEAIKLFQEIFDVPGVFMPATSEDVSISAETVEGKIIKGEEAIDLGKYNGKRILKHVFLHPKNPTVSKELLNWLGKADVIIAGPGDLYTTILPVLIIPAISDMLKKRHVPKFFVVNITNKPFETKGYAVSDYVDAVIKHLGVFPFDKIIVNSNHSIKIPSKFHYAYVKDGASQDTVHTVMVKGDFLDTTFPLYHSPQKLAKAIFEHI